MANAQASVHMPSSSWRTPPPSVQGFFYRSELDPSFDYLQLLNCSISERSIGLSRQTRWVSSITEPNRSQSNDWSSIGLDFRYPANTLKLLGSYYNSKNGVKILGT